MPRGNRSYAVTRILSPAQVLKIAQTKKQYVTSISIPAPSPVGSFDTGPRTLTEQQSRANQSMVADLTKNLGDRRDIFTAASQGQTKQKLGSRYENFSPELKQLYDSVVAKEAAAGIDSSKREKKRDSFLHRVIDVLSRPNYAVANAFNAADIAGKKAENTPGNQSFSIFAATIDGAWEGLKGKEKIYFSKLIEEDAKRNPKGFSELLGKNKISKVGVGLTADILLDPTSYIGLGIGAKAAKGKAVIKTEAEVAKSADELAAKLFDDYGIVYRGGEAVAAGEKTAVASREAEIGATAANLTRSSVVGKTVPTAALQAGVIKDNTRFVLGVGQRVEEVEKARIAANLTQARAAEFKAIIDDTVEKTTKVLKENLTKEDFKQYRRLQSERAHVMALIRKQADETQRVALTSRLTAINTKLDDYVKLHIKDDAEWVAAAKASDGYKQLDDKVKGLYRQGQRVSQQIAQKKADGVNVAGLEEKKKRITAAWNAAREERDDFFAATAHKAMEEAAIKGRSAKGKFVPKGLGVKGERVVQDTVVIKGMTAAEKAAATAHNNRILGEISKVATTESKRIADETRNAILEILVRESNLPIRKSLDLRIAAPFTKGNNPAQSRYIPLLHTEQAIPSAAVKAADALARTDPVQSSKTLFDKFFKSSAGTDPYLNRVRLSYWGSSSARIEFHSKRLKDTWAKFPVGDRIDAFRTYIRSGVTTANPLTKLIDEEFEVIGQTFKHADNINGVIKADTINNWLPSKYSLDLKGIDTTKYPTGSGAWFREALRQNPEKLDPVELFWHLNIAKQKIMARQAIKANVIEQFGIDVSKLDNATRKAFTAQGYKHVEELGRNAIFAPEIADQVTKLFSLLKSDGAAREFIRFADSIQSRWKALVTIWNPGYHIRNTFGDMFVSYLNGVSGKSGLQSYRASSRVLRAVNKLPEDSAVKAAIYGDKSASPWEALQHGSAVPTNTPVYRTAKGKVVTAEEIWTLYHQYGLHTGFVSNEFGAAFSRPGAIGSSPVGRAATNTGQQIRAMSEFREDYFRLAHFIHVMKRSKSTDIEQAAGEAADAVRKFHFDYSDFTPTEKQIFARLIPFYKWSRKALPLMAETMFLQPGKALSYPKGMRAFSELTGYELDPNDPIPASDQVIPDWIQDRGAVPAKLPFGIGGENTVFIDPSVPFNDVAKSLDNPGQWAASGLTPLLRVPLEQTTGLQFFGNRPIKDQSDYWMNQAPQLSAARQIFGNPDNSSATDVLSDPRTLQFLTALGLFENNERTQRGALLGRQAEANEALKKLNASRNKQEP